MTRSDAIEQPRTLIPVTHRRILALALPMTLSHVTTPLLGFVGATVIGRLGDAALLGAVALGAVIFDFIFWTFGSLRMATAGFTAQATGAGNTREIDCALGRALVVAGLVGLALIVLQVPIGWLAFKVTGGSPAVTHALAIYFHIRIFAAPFTLANYAILGSTLGRGRTDLGLLLQVAINVTDIVLTLALVLGLGWGIAGAGVATVLAEITGAGLGLLVLRRLGTRPWAVPRSELFARAAMLRMLAVNRDVMIRTAALVSAFTLFASLGARSGDVTLAANAVLQNMFLIGSYFLDGFATAAETLCGQAAGAGAETSFRRAVRLSLTWCLGFGLCVAALFYSGGDWFIDTVTTNQAVRETARQFLGFAALSPLIGAPAFAYDGIYVGATWTVAMRNLMLAAFACYMVSVIALSSLGNAGLWLALLVFFGARAGGQAWLYPRLTRRTFPAPSRGVLM